MGCIGRKMKVSFIFCTSWLHKTEHVYTYLYIPIYHSLEFMNHGEYFFKFMGLSNSYDLIHGVLRFIVTEFMAFLDS